MHEAVKAVLEAYINYLKKHGKRIVTFVKLIGQDTIMTEVESLYWYYKPTRNYPRLEDALKDILSREELLKELRDTGLEIVSREDGRYIKVHVNKLFELFNRAMSEEEQQL